MTLALMRARDTFFKGGYPVCRMANTVLDYSFLESTLNCKDI